MHQGLSRSVTGRECGTEPGPLYPRSLEKGTCADGRKGDEQYDDLPPLLSY